MTTSDVIFCRKKNSLERSLDDLTNAFSGFALRRLGAEIDRGVSEASHT